MPAHRHHDSNRIVSRHQTSEGVVVYRRCHCGALQVSLHRPGRRPTAISDSRHATDPVRL
jgi:hypothetical protein